MSRVRLVRARVPSTGPSACAFAGRRCALRGWRRGVPGGGLPCAVARGVWGQALPLNRLSALRAGCRGPSLTCCGRGRAGVGAQHCPCGLHALWELRASGMVGAVPGGGLPATVLSGVWCQALSLPHPLILWGGQPGFRDPSVPVAVGAGVGTQHEPHSVCPCGPALRAVGVAEGRPRGGCLAQLFRASAVRRSLSSDCPPYRRAVEVRHPRAVGAVVRVWGPSTVPLACMPSEGCVPRGWWGAVPGGGGLPPL